MKWIGVLGLGLTLAGALVALFGVEDLYGNFFPGRALGLHWVWRRLRPPKPRTISVTAHADLGGISATAFDSVTKGRPDFTKPDAVMAWVEWYVNDLRAEITRVRTEGDRKLAEMDKRVDERTADLVDEIKKARDTLRDTIAGVDGKGLRLTWMGLVVGGLGIVLQLAAAW
jgi:hypothetical protein